MPSVRRSSEIARSNSANTANMPNSARLPLVLVSICWSRTRVSKDHVRGPCLKPTQRHVGPRREASRGHAAAKSRPGKADRLFRKLICARCNFCRLRGYPDRHGWQFSPCRNPRRDKLNTLAFPRLGVLLFHSSVPSVGFGSRASRALSRAATCRRADLCSSAISS
jgi:hypothetical protein